jgi:hypothetical protein
MYMYRKGNDLFWDWLNDWPLSPFGNIAAPDGYELVEKAEHKADRLQKSVDEKKASVSYLTKKLTEITAEIESEERELGSLKTSTGTQP